MWGVGKGTVRVEVGGVLGRYDREGGFVFFRFFFPFGFFSHQQVFHTYPSKHQWWWACGMQGKGVALPTMTCYLYTQQGLRCFYGRFRVHYHLGVLVCIYIRHGM